MVVLKDTNHDGVMDKRTVFADGLILPRALNVPAALDNWMHTTGTDVSFRFEDQKVEVQPTLSCAEWGAPHDDTGRIHRNTNESALHVV